MNNRILWFTLAIAPALFVILLLGVSLRNGDANSAPGLVNAISGPVHETERGVPEFSLAELRSDEIVTQDSFLGEILLIDFWSSWCPPCQTEAGTLADVYGEYRNQGVEFLGIAIWDSRPEIENFIEAIGSSYPMSLDDDGRVAVAFGVTGVPEKFIVNATGSITYHVRGPMEAEDLRSLLDDALSKKDESK